MSRRGFTLIELSVVLAVTALAVPLALMFHRQYEAAQLTALAQVEAAEGMRALSEELRRDLRVLQWSDEKSLSLVSTGACKDITYELTPEHVLIRKAGAGCGPARPVARDVRSIARDGQGLVVTFARRVRGPDEVATTFRLGLTPAPAPQGGKK